MSSEMTRGSITGQVKALSMIVAIEGLIPDRRAGSAEKKNASPPAAWRATRQEETTGPETNPAQEEDGPGIPEAEPAHGSPADAPPDLGPIFDPSHSSLSETQPAPHAPPDTRVPFSIKKNPFARRR